MKKIKLTGKQLRAIGYPEGPVISVAMNTIEKHYKFEKEETVMNVLKAILASPVEYADDAVLGLISAAGCVFRYLTWTRKTCCKRKLVCA